MSNNKQTIKLYTEEQMHTVMLLALGRYEIHSNRKVLKENQDLIDSLKPIELPREKYGIFNPQRLIFETLGGKYGLQSHDEHDQVDGYYDTYEEAELACLRRLIEIVNKNNNEQQ